MRLVLHLCSFARRAQSPSGRPSAGPLDGLDPVHPAHPPIPPPLDASCGSAAIASLVRMFLSIEAAFDSVFSNLGRDLLDPALDYRRRR
jgi:hypothetical protein